MFSLQEDGEILHCLEEDLHGHGASRFNFWSPRIVGLDIVIVCVDCVYSLRTLLLIVHFNKI